MCLGGRTEQMRIYTKSYLKLARKFVKEGCAWLTTVSDTRMKSQTSYCCENLQKGKGAEANGESHTLTTSLKMQMTKNTTELRTLMVEQEYWRQHVGDGGHPGGRHR